MRAVKRTILAVVLVLMGLSVVYGFTVTRRERLYRQLVLHGDSALAQGDTSGAIGLFTSAIGLKPESMLGYLKRGEAHYRRGDLEVAAADLGTASTLDPTAPRALELLGDVEAARQFHARAAEHYAASVSLDDRSHRVLYKLGLSRHLAGQNEAALDALTRAINLDSRSAEAQYLLGVCLRELSRPREAEQALKRAIALAPSLLPAREQLADLYGALGRRLARIRELEQLLAADTRPARHVSLALAYAHAGQTPRAVSLLRSTAELYPDYAGTHLAVGRLWLLAFSKEGQDRAALNSAIEALQQAVSLDASGAALTELGKAHLAAGDAPAAERTLRQAAETLPADPAVFLHLASASERINEFREARRALLDFHALAPEDERPDNLEERIAELSMRLHEPDVAVRWYAAAANGPRVSSSVLLGLAEAHRQTGNVEAARGALDRVLERDPDNLAARALARRLRGGQ